jgi:uncharacterized protein
MPRIKEGNQGLMTSESHATLDYSGAVTWKHGKQHCRAPHSFVFIAFLTVLPIRADLQSGLAAYEHKDYSTALRELTPHAEQGNASAQAHLAVMYRRGWGVPQDFLKARTLAKSAAGKQDATGLNVLGNLLQSGQGTAKNESEAVRYYRLAANKGYSAAYFNLGSAYEYGRGVATDVAEAKRWYRLAAEKGNAAAQYSLACLAEAADKAPPDYPEMLKWLYLSAAEKYPAALVSLGSAYLNGRGVERNYARGLELLRQAVSLGSAYGQYRLAEAYESGEGVPINLNESIRLYTLAINQNYPNARASLAALLINPSGVPRDCTEGLRLARLDAADQSIIGQTVLGHAHFWGTCVPQDYDEARKWYERAAARGSNPARVNLAYLHMHGLGGAHLSFAAETHLTLAAATGDQEAKSALLAFRNNKTLGLSAGDRRRSEEAKVRREERRWSNRSSRADLRSSNGAYDEARRDVLALLGAPSRLTEQLIDAAAAGDTKTMKTLLGSGADINGRGRYGMTALIVAVGCGQREAVRVLLEHKADTRVKDTLGLTYLDYAGATTPVQFFVHVEALHGALAELNEHPDVSAELQHNSEARMRHRLRLTDPIAVDQLRSSQALAQMEFQGASVDGGQAFRDSLSGLAGNARINRLNEDASDLHIAWQTRSIWESYIRNVIQQCILSAGPRRASVSAALQVFLKAQHLEKLIPSPPGTSPGRDGITQ